MAPLTEGTFVLDGLIEGHTPTGKSAPTEWVALLRGMGLAVELEVDGTTFSLLANEATTTSPTLGPPRTQQLREALEQLVQTYHDPVDGPLFSTLRSVEVQPGRKIQTLYIIRPDGTIEAPERVLDAKTAPPATPPSLRQWLKAGSLALLALVAVFGISSLFVDWGSTVRGLWQEVVPFDAEHVALASRFEPYFRIKSRERTRGGAALRLDLERTEIFPLDDRAIGVAREAAPQLSTGRRLALDALARGYVRAEVFGEDGTLLLFKDIRIAGLRERATLSVEIPVPRSPRPARIILTY